MRAHHIASVLALTVLATAATIAAEPSSNRIDVTAVPSKFTPNHIRVHVGQSADLHFEHTEGIHSFVSRELGIDYTVLEPGKDVDVTFTPTKVGTYVLRCGVVCGVDHDNMSLTVIVEE